MFITGSEREDEGLQSRYGKPQHEMPVGNAWEFEQYGEADPAFPPGPIEFVPAVEYPFEIDGSEKGGTNRLLEPLSVGD